MACDETQTTESAFTDYFNPMFEEWAWPLHRRIARVARVGQFSKVAFMVLVDLGALSGETSTSLVTPKSRVSNFSNERHSNVIMFLFKNGPLEKGPAGWKELANRWNNISSETRSKVLGSYQRIRGTSTRVTRASEKQEQTVRKWLEHLRNRSKPLERTLRHLRKRSKPPQGTR